MAAGVVFFRSHTHLLKSEVWVLYNHFFLLALQTIDPTAYGSLKGNLTEMMDALQSVLDMQTQVWLSPRNTSLPTSHGHVHKPNQYATLSIHLS